MNDTPERLTLAPTRGTLLGLRAIAFAMTCIGVWAMLVLSPRVPYADPWRFVATYLTQPFPANVVFVDNGHCEVLPNVVRVADLALGGDQWLQIGTGIALALGVLFVMRRWWRDDDPVLRAAATAIACSGVFWLGNARKLAHGNEVVSEFCVVGSIVAGITALRSLPRGGGCACTWIAAVAAIVATFSFGAGIAAFPAFAVLLFVQRASLRQWLPLLIAATGTLLMLRLAGTGQMPPGLALLDRAELLLRWLGAPFVWILSPLLDPVHAAHLPTDSLRAAIEPIASAATDAFGPRLLARWPALLFGGVAFTWLAVLTWRQRQVPGRSVERAALALAWFGVFVGVLVATLRTDYFDEHPQQVPSRRYVPWSMLTWTGLLLATVLRDSVRPARAALVAATFALMLMPSQVWTGIFAWTQRVVAERTACGAAVGVIATDFDMIESDWRDVARAVPVLREHGKAMFAWPETKLLGTQPAPGTVDAVAMHEVAVRAVRNRFDGAGMVARFGADGGGRLLLLDATGTVRGLAVRVPFEDAWHGWLRGTVEAADLRAARLR